MPGRMAFALIPELASSRAIPFTKEFKAPLDAIYIMFPMEAKVYATDEINTTEALFLSSFFLYSF
jgi:hypothetical protein